MDLVTPATPFSHILDPESLQVSLRKPIQDLSLSSGWGQKTAAGLVPVGGLNLLGPSSLLPFYCNSSPPAASEEEENPCTDLCRTTFPLRRPS